MKKTNFLFSKIFSSLKFFQIFFDNLLVFKKEIRFYKILKYIMVLKYVLLF